MNAKELIAELEKLPPETEILIAEVGGHDYTVEPIRLTPALIGAPCFEWQKPVPEGFAYLGAPIGWETWTTRALGV